MEEKKITRSFFSFEITQTTKVLWYKIQQGDGKRWDIHGQEATGHVSLCEIGHPENHSLVLLGNGYMRIVTATSGYEYVIQDKEGDGAEVTFSGPVNALLAQALIPRMTYVPQTLQGMSEDMDDYVPIADFMEKRAERNAADPNPQDRLGWKVNMRFNNELIPYLPPFNGKGVEKSKRNRERTGKFSRA